MARLRVRPCSRLPDEHADLRAPRYTVASVSAEMRLRWNFVGRLDLTDAKGAAALRSIRLRLVRHRRWQIRSYATVSVAMNEYFVNNSRYTNYKAAEFALRRTFLSKYQWFASYTRSRPIQFSGPVFHRESAAFAAVGRSVTLGCSEPDSDVGLGTGGEKWFPSLFRPIVGDTDIQLLGEFHTGFPFTSITEAGYLAGPPDSRRYPRIFC